MKIVSRQTIADWHFATVVGVGALLLAGFILAGVRTAGLVRQLNGWAHPACGCSGNVTIGWPIVTGTIFGALAAIIVLAMAVCSIVLMLRTRRFRNAFRVRPTSDRILKIAAQLGLSGLVSEVESLDREVFCAGLIRPRLYVSSAILDVLDDSELRAVLMHEACHVRKRDPLRLFLVDVLTLPVRLIPGWRRSHEEFRASVELAADEAVIARLGRQDISRAVLKLIPNGLQPAVSVSFFGLTDRRIDQLLGIRRRGTVLTMVGLMAIGLGMTALAATASTRVASLSEETGQSSSGICQFVQAQCRQSSGPSWTPSPDTSTVQFISTP